jgi:membrane-bound lytic murein transglycosylase MltF
VESNQVQEVHHNEEAVMQEYPDANWNHDGNQEVKDLLDMSEPNQEVEVPIENSNEA